MTVRLYHIWPSFCSQKVRLALAEKGVTYAGQVVNIGPAMENYEPWYVRLNPAAVVPTLVHDDQVITDSSRILRYIDASFDGPPLHPDGPDEQAEMDALVEGIDALPIRVLSYGTGPAPSVLQAMVGLRVRRLEAYRDANPDLAAAYEAKLEDVRRWQDGMVDEATVEAAKQSVLALLDIAEAQLADGRSFYVEGRYTLADVMLTVLVARLFMLGLGGWIRARPPVHRWYDDIRERPSFQEARLMERLRPGILLPIVAPWLLPRLAIATTAVLAAGGLLVWAMG